MGKIEAFKAFMAAFKGKEEFTPELLSACNDENQETQKALLRYQFYSKIVSRVVFGIMTAIFIICLGDLF